MPRPKSFDASSVEGIIDQRNFRGRLQYQIACADEIPQWMDSDKLMAHPSIAALIQSFHDKSYTDTEATTSTISPKATKRGRKSRAASSIEEKVEEVKEEKKSRSRSRVRSTTIEVSTPPPRYSRSKKAELTPKIQSSGKRGRPKKQTIEASTENEEVDDRQLSMAEELKQPIDYFASHFQPVPDEKSDGVAARVNEAASIVYGGEVKHGEESSHHRHGRPINHLRGQSILFGFILLFFFAYFSILDHSSPSDRTALAGFLPSIIHNALWNFLDSIMQTSISLSDIIAVPLFILVSQLLDGRRGVYEQRVLHCAVLFFTLSFYRYLVEGSAVTLNPLAPPVFHCITTAIASFHTVFLIRNITSNKLTVARFLYSSLSATVAIIALYHQYTKPSSSALMQHHIFTLLAAASFDAILSFSFIVIAYSRALAKSFQIASGLLMAIGSIIYGIILFQESKSGLQFFESWCAATILCGLDFLWLLDSWTHENNKKKQKEVHA